jgi:hypothetical protein
MRINNYAVLGRFGPKSSVCTPSKRQNLYPENKNVRFWDYKHNDVILLHPLKTAKPLSRKQESMF